MPVQKGQAKGLLAKLGQRVLSAHNKAKDEETEYGNLGDLPAGINGGIAQLVDIELKTIKEGKKNAGEFMFYASGVVVSPKTFEGAVTEGMRTTIMELLCDTPESTGQRKKFEDHYAWMLNELRKLGIDTKTMKADDLEVTLNALKQSKPFFRFRTWKGQMQTSGQYAGKEPRTNHDWGGLASDYSGAVDSIGAVEDNTVAGVDDGTDSGDEGAVTPDPEDVIDFIAMGEAAEGGDDDAQTQLSEAATAAGLTEDQIKEAEDWNALAALVAEASGGGSTTEDNAGGGWVVGEACMYAPVNPTDKTGTKRLKKVQCSIMEISPDGLTVLLKNLDDPKKKYKGVSVNEIEPA